MNNFFGQISNTFSEPFLELFYQAQNFPIIAGFFLGVVGALAPCQFTGNLGAIAIYGNRSIQNKIAWAEVFLFILGKIFVFSFLGLVVWYFGNEIEQSLLNYFPWIRKIVGPLMIIIGLFLLGIFKSRMGVEFIKLPDKWFKKGKLGAFLMGVSFSLGFCPTMFVLFFVTLLPYSFTVGYGYILPTVFSIGTSLPLLIAIFLLWLVDVDNRKLKMNGRNFGGYLQKATGLFIIFLGIVDFTVYWL
ncbi:cytochrome C biosynthesis protein [Chryseomicrobium excrementi]|uniref:Cytochrome C biosynthesis protein n=1 Tax=Chryseomicrobium excrementi TaxID=2041346 RepID=A0A2M9EZE3_9BACL|nr:sulfite exporter TauE/SafE family protein [Chryseomicrobium excrementi]PJK16569.1 cytochrome C biosynthesis protein [Chryseomicrobium excrementi]